MLNLYCGRYNYILPDHNSIINQMNVPFTHDYIMQKHRGDFLPTAQTIDYAASSNFLNRKRYSYVRIDIKSTSSTCNYFNLIKHDTMVRILPLSISDTTII